jgi:uncharacterized YigZ family protein
MADSFQTLIAPSESLYKVKGSKHLGYAYPISSEEDVKPLIDALKKDHFNARHHCYAYRLGADGERYRANDDGEPSGTAGKPILGQLLSFEITNVLVVVVRYFGGTKLGTSGLIDAYKTAAKMAIEEGTIVEKKVMKTFEIQFPYAAMGAVMSVFKAQALEMLHHSFDSRCYIKSEASKESAAIAEQQLSEIDHVSFTWV